MTTEQKKQAKKLYIIVSLVLFGLLQITGLLERLVSALSGGLGDMLVYIFLWLFFLVFMQKTPDWNPGIFSMKKDDTKPVIMGVVSALLLCGIAFRMPDGIQALDENFLKLLIIAADAFGIEFFFRVYGSYIFGGTDYMGVNDYIFMAAVYAVFKGLLAFVATLGNAGAAAAAVAFAAAAGTGFFAGLMITAVYARTDSVIAAVILNVLCNMGPVFAFNSASGKGLGLIGTILTGLGCVACLATAASLIPGNVPHYTDHD